LANLEFLVIISVFAKFVPVLGGLVFMDLAVFTGRVMTQGLNLEPLL